MTSGKANQLAIVADAVTCVKCRINPRFGSLQRCKQCLRVDAEVERIARERLLPALTASAAKPSARQQTAASSSATRKARGARPAPAPARDASAPAAASRARPQPVRPPPEPLTAKTWKTRITNWVKRCWGANDPDVQERIAVRDIGSDLIEQSASKIDYVYGGPHGAPHMRVFANGDPHLDVMRSVAERMWRLPVKGEVVTANGVSDLRTACPHCGVRVRIPCNESKARNCQNRRTR